jgi:drug/metabolite transporter (DMT)-like permease
LNSTRADQSAGWLAQFVALGAIWGSSFMFMRLAVADFGPVATATLRVSLGALFLLPLLLWRGQWPALRARWPAIFFVGLLNSGIPFALFAFSLLTITTGLSSIINATVPMFGALVAWLWLGERLGLWRIAGLVLGFVGVTLLAWDQAGLRAGASALHPIWAMLACLGACISYALAASYTRLYLQDVPPLAAATGSQIGAALGMALPALWLWPQQAPSQAAWLSLLVLGALCTGVAYLLYFRLLGSASPSRALAVTYLIPLFAVSYGVTLLDEPFTAGMGLSALVILLGTAMATGMIAPDALLQRFRKRPDSP